MACAPLAVFSSSEWLILFAFSPKLIVYSDRFSTVSRREGLCCYIGWRGKYGLCAGVLPSEWLHCATYHTGLWGILHARHFITFFRLLNITHCTLHTHCTAQLVGSQSRCEDCALLDRRHEMPTAMQCNAIRCPMQLLSISSVQPHRC